MNGVDHIYYMPMRKDQVFSTPWLLPLRLNEDRKEYNFQLTELIQDRSWKIYNENGIDSSATKSIAWKLRTRISIQRNKTDLIHIWSMFWALKLKFLIANSKETSETVELEWDYTWPGVAPRKAIADSLERERVSVDGEKGKKGGIGGSEGSTAWK